MIGTNRQSDRRKVSGYHARGWRWVGALSVVCLLLAPVKVSAQEAAGVREPARDSAVDSAVESRAINDARKALSSGKFPWYNSQTDSLQPIEIEVEEPKKPRKKWDLSFGPLLDIIVWSSLGLILAAVVYLLFLFARNQSRAPKIERLETDEIVEPDQVEALPFLAERPRDDLLGQARRHYEAGNYSEAIIYLFSYELVALDRFSLIQLAKGKTNRQYLREVDRDAAVRSPLERTLVAFESVFFGRRTLDRAGFEACWNELPLFEQQLRAQA